MKKLFSALSLLLLFSVLIITLSACSEPKNPDAPIGKYIYEGEGFGGDFTLTIKADGTFNYYEGWLSSYIATGEWTLDKNILCLKDEGYPFTNYFEVKDDQLVFIEEESSNFLYMDIKDGENFNFVESE